MYTLVTLKQNSYHNYMQYLSQWYSEDTSQRASFSPTKRPNPVAMLNDNITITGSWIDAKPMEAVSDRCVINNITMAFPHTGVFSAAHDPTNQILQPLDLGVCKLYHLSRI